MNLVLSTLAGASLALGLTACFDADTSGEAADPAPVANPVTTSVGSVANAPGLGQSLSAAAGGGGGGGGQGRAPRGGETFSASDIDFRVTNPATGSSLAVYAELPSSSPPYKAIVVVPGGVKDASGVFSRDGMRQPILNSGVAIFRFDPDGRGQSGGSEDLGGKVQQAGLREVIAQVIARDDVIDDQVGVFSNSMGIQMASGALANGKTGARFLIDYEGPSSRAYTAGCEGNQGMTRPPWPPGLDCGDDAYWGEREAQSHMATVTVPYQRIQRAQDHVHGTDAGHAVALYQAALDGPSPWVRLNTLESNLSVTKIQQAERPDVGFPTLYSWYADYINDMFVVIGGGKPPAHNHTMNDGQGGAPPVRGQGGGGGGGGKGRKRGGGGRR